MGSRLPRKGTIQMPEAPPGIDRFTFASKVNHSPSWAAPGGLGVLSGRAVRRTRPPPWRMWVRVRGKRGRWALLGSAGGFVGALWRFPGLARFFGPRGGGLWSCLCGGPWGRDPVCLFLGRERVGAVAVVGAWGVGACCGSQGVRRGGSATVRGGPRPRGAPPRGRRRGASFFTPSPPIVLNCRKSEEA